MKIIILVILLLLNTGSAYGVSGSWTGQKPCPVPISNDGRTTYRTTFYPLGGIPDNAVVTLVTGSIDIQMPNTPLRSSWISSSNGIQLVFDTYYFDTFFDGLPAADSSFLLSIVAQDQADWGIGGVCIINVSWEVPNESIVVDFPTYGVYEYENEQWTQLNSEPTTQISSTNEFIVIDFGSQYGIWLYDSTWTKLHSLTSEGLTTGDLDGNGQVDVIIDFGIQYGLWAWMNNSSWKHIHNITAEQIVTKQLDDNNKADLLVDFGSQYGLWVWKNNIEWEQLHSESPKLIGN